MFQLKHMVKPNGEVDEIPITLGLTATGSELIRRMEAEECEYCGRIDLPTQVHHVRKLEDLKSKPHLELWQEVMIARNRKTLILCSGTPDSCHVLLHQGKLPSTAWRKFTYYFHTPEITDSRVAVMVGHRRIGRSVD